MLFTPKYISAHLYKTKTQRLKDLLSENRENVAWILVATLFITLVFSAMLTHATIVDRNFQSYVNTFQLKKHAPFNPIGTVDGTLIQGQ